MPKASDLVLRVTLRPLPTLRTLVDYVLPERARPFEGKRIVVTGASSGIGKATSLRLAELGADVMMVARRADELETLLCDIIEAGGCAHAFSCDLTDADDVDLLVQTILERWGSVDVLVNSAGRSIRRTAEESLDRLHDYERTMALNYFGPVRLTLGLLPSMLARRRGHIINVGTWGVPVGSMPRFGAYISSKSALTTFGRSLNAEIAHRGVRVTAVHYPLVRTEMIAPTTAYQGAPALTPREAAEWIVTAIKNRPNDIQPTYSVILRGISLVSTSLVDAMIRRSGI